MSMIECFPNTIHLDRVLTDKEKTVLEPLDYLWGFGQGPVKPQESGALNLRGLIVTLAVGELKQLGLTNGVLVSGGKTGGEQLPPEAKLMRTTLVKNYSIFEEDILIEDKSLTTVENIIYGLNLLDEITDLNNPPSIGIVSIGSHLPRIKLILDYFGVKADKIFAAEEVLRILAQRTNNQKIFDILDLFDPRGGNGTIEKMHDENISTYAFLTPECRIKPYFGYLNDKRLTYLLVNHDQDFKAIGINPSDSLESIKEKLLKLSPKRVDEKYRNTKNWPSPVEIFVRNTPRPSTQYSQSPVPVSILS